MLFKIIMADINKAFSEPNPTVADLWKFRTTKYHGFDNSEKIYEYKLKQNLIKFADMCGGCGKPRREHGCWSRKYFGFILLDCKFVETLL